jgi:hypothetical protein
MQTQALARKVPFNGTLGSPVCCHWRLPAVVQQPQRLLAGVYVARGHVDVVKAGPSTPHVLGPGLC